MSIHWDNARAPSGVAARACLPRCPRLVHAQTDVRARSGLAAIPLGESFRQVMTGRLPECEAA